MRAALRFLIAASAVALALGQAPLLAQEAPPPADAPAASESIGPRELENFSLNGTVTRPAPTTPAPPAPAPVRPGPAAATPAQSGPSVAPPRDRPVAGIATGTPERAPSLTITLPPADALTDTPTPSATVEVPAVESDFAAAEDNASLSAPSLGIVPWLIALILLGAAAGYYFWRQRARPSYAAAGGFDSFAAAEPSPAPRGRSLPPAPAPAPSSSGVVSTRLRPWLDIEFEPARCVVEEDNARIEFDVSVFNSGSAPARDVLIEAGMFNAGPTLDQEIGAFFANPVAKGERIPVIQPLKRIALKSAVSLTHAELRQFEAAGRRFFVPLLAFNTLYRWNAGDGQTSASYLVGRDIQGEKMAPFRLDLGPRIFRGLGAREHNIGLRK